LPRRSLLGHVGSSDAWRLELGETLLCTCTTTKRARRRALRPPGLLSDIIAGGARTAVRVDRVHFFHLAFMGRKLASKRRAPVPSACSVQPTALCVDMLRLASAHARAPLVRI